MKFDIKKIIYIDRRIIYIFIFLAVLIPYVVPFNLPSKADKYVMGMYNKIEEIAKKGNGTILISFDFDMASKAELEPMAKAIIAHIFQRNIKLIVQGNWPNGVQMTKDILIALGKEYNKVYGEDWVYLGYKTGGTMVIMSLGKDLHNTFPKDYIEGKSTTELAVTKNIKSLKEVDYVISLSAGNGGIEEWIVYGQSKIGFPLGGACTAVMAPDFFPFLHSGQLNGLLGGLVGAAQYEGLVNRLGDATQGMKPQSVTHIVLILFILFGNFCYFVEKFIQKKEKANS